MARKQQYIGPRPLEQQPKYVQKAEAKRLAKAAQQVIDDVMTAPRPSSPPPPTTPKSSSMSEAGPYDFVPKPYGGEFAWASGHRGHKRPKRERSTSMSFADTQAQTFGPVPFQQQPRKVRRAYSYDYRRKQAKWARKRPSDSAGSSSSWGARDEGRALNRYRGGGYEPYWGGDQDDPSNYAPRRSRRRRSGGGNKYWTAAAWGGGSGGRSRRPKRRRASASSWYTPRPSRRRRTRSLGSYFSPRSCRTKRSRFKAAWGMVGTRYSPKRLRSFGRKRRSGLVGSALSQLSAYCSALRPARGRRRKSSGRRGYRRARRGRR